jgi:PAS domain S-box-containing protein
LKNLALEDRIGIFDTINDAITIHDDDYNIIHANEAAEKMLKLSSREIRSRKCYQSYHGSDKPPKVCPSCKTLKRGKATAAEVFEPHLNKYVEIKALPRINKKGKIIGLIHVVRDFTRRHAMEEELKKKAGMLEETNTALKVLLDHRKRDEEYLSENIICNVQNLLLPYITKLKNNNLKPEELTYLNIIETNLNEILSPFSRSLLSKDGRFTPKELLVINLIKDGRKDKDTAEILNMSLDTVKTHRKNIRKKLGINNKKTNLQTHLLSQ